VAGRIYRLQKRPTRTLLLLEDDPNKLPEALRAVSKEVRDPLFTGFQAPDYAAIRVPVLALFLYLGVQIRTFR